MILVGSVEGGVGLWGPMGRVEGAGPCVTPPPTPDEPISKQHGAEEGPGVGF